MAELNFKQITDKLNEEFAGDTRKLIFWYDANAEFAEDKFAKSRDKLDSISKRLDYSTKYFESISYTPLIAFRLWFNRNGFDNYTINISNLVVQFLLFKKKTKGEDTI